MDVNRLVLSANVLEARPLRYTPAGLPVLEMELEHAADVLEAGVSRRVELTLSAIALGDIALMLADTGLGTHLELTGFLAPSRKGSRRLVLHIQQASRYPSGSDTVVA